MGLSVLVIDVSAFRRGALAEAARSSSVVSAVEISSALGLALRRLENRPADVVLVDVDLLREAGPSALGWIAARVPSATIVVVGATAAPDGDELRRALRLGGAEAAARPVSRDPATALDEARAALAPILGAAAARARVRPAVRPPAGRALVPAPGGTVWRPSRFWAAAVAVSTGGPEALAKFIPKIPGDFPLPVLVVQHMPPVFTASLAARLDGLSPLRVVEGAEGDAVTPGVVYIAPGGRHMTVREAQGRPTVAIVDTPPENSCRPAADVLFRSLAEYPSARGVLAVVMTGMGADGLAGVRALKRRDCHCITQSEETCVVYGMPQVVVAAGLSDETAPLDRLAERLAARAVAV